MAFRTELKNIRLLRVPYIPQLPIRFGVDQTSRRYLITFSLRADLRTNETYIKMIHRNGKKDRSDYTHTHIYIPNCIYACTSAYGLQVQRV